MTHCSCDWLIVIFYSCMYMIMIIYMRLKSLFYCYTEDFGSQFVTFIEFWVEFQSKFPFTLPHSSFFTCPFGVALGHLPIVMLPRTNKLRNVCSFGQIAELVRANSPSLIWYEHSTISRSHTMEMLRQGNQILSPGHMQGAYKTDKASYMTLGHPSLRFE